jgi:phage tail sheath protein FI
MAETLISPGVLARENDQSQITSNPVTAGAAILGPTVKGKSNIPKVVTSYSQFEAEFGTTFISGSTNEFSFFTSISANNYFAQGGTSLLVTRITSGTFQPATSSIIPTGSDGAGGGLAADTSPFVLETFSDGEIMNSTGAEGANNILTNGTKDNLRWEIASPNSASGVFTLLIRRGDDTHTSKTILETFTNVSLDPRQSNYIERVVGNQTQNTVGSGTDIYVRTTGSYPNASNFVRVSAVNFTTPDYFDNNGAAKNEFTASIPAASSGTFGDGLGATYSGANTLYENLGSTTQGLIADNYTDAINLLSNKDDYRFNVISTPGLNNADHSTPIGSLIEMVEDRGDAIAIVDMTRYGSTVQIATAEASERDSSFAATYWPWLQVNEPNSGQIVWAPASTLIPGVYANNDAVSETWFAPAGFNRGGLVGVVQAERKLSQTNRDTLYVGKVNPIATFPGRGVVVFGQKTLQQRASALDRVNVRRLLISLKSFISQVSDNLVFEQNTAATRNNFLAQVNPFLASVQQRQGLFAFKVVMDETNNTSDVIDRNQLVGQIFIQPTRTAEFILLDFNVLPTGATFPS